MEERRSRYDPEHQQEEADTIIVQQVLGCVEDTHQIYVVLFALLLCVSYSLAITNRQD